MRVGIAAVVIGLVWLAPADGRPEPKTLRVLTYNIRHGEGTDGKLDLARVAGVIAAAKPDLVALQEVDRKTKRAGKVDQAAELAKLTGLTAEFAKAIDFQGGGYGLATLSRFPVKDVTVHKLPGGEKQEARVVLQTTVAPPGRPALTLLNTHFSHEAAATREQQAARIDAVFGTTAAPFILAGDLNMPAGEAPIKTLAKNWTFATAPGGKGLLTFPAPAPKQQIDYVLFRPAGRFKVVEVTVIEEKVASDHRPVLVVLAWAGK